MTLYDWCLQHQHTDILDIWDNTTNPRDIMMGTHKRFCVKCPKCNLQGTIKISSLVNNPKYKFVCKYCNSFGVWCEENQSLWLQYWDYDKNDFSPYDISKTNGNKAYFKCSRGLHESELTRISDITSYKKVPYQCRACSSFEQWCIDNDHKDLLDRWDYDLNQLSPREVRFSSGKKYYFKCPNNMHPSESKLLSNVIKQEGSRKCLGCNSFAQININKLGEEKFYQYWSNKNDINPYEYSVNSAKRVWINCLKNPNHPAYQIKMVDFSRGHRCPYCSHYSILKEDSVGYKYPDIIKIWSERNTMSYFELHPYSNKDVFLLCPKHGEYRTKIYDALDRYMCCPQCNVLPNSSNLQRKVADYIQTKYNYTLKHESGCSLYPINPRTNYRLPYDNEIVELKMIIEVMGIQHYEISGFTKLAARHYHITLQEAFEYDQWKDEFKKQYVLDNNYYYLAIPYWTEKTEEYKNLIDEAISQREKELHISPNM